MPWLCGTLLGLLSLSSAFTYVESFKLEERLLPVPLEPTDTAKRGVKPEVVVVQKVERELEPQCVADPVIDPYSIDICYDFSPDVNCIVRDQTGYTSMTQYFTDMTTAVENTLSACLGANHPKLRFRRAELRQDFSIGESIYAGQQMGYSSITEQTTMGYCNNPAETPTRYEKLQAMGCDIILVVSKDPNLCCATSRGFIMVNGACTSKSCGFSCLDDTIDQANPFGYTQYYLTHEILHAVGLTHDNMGYDVASCYEQTQALMDWPYWCDSPEQCTGCYDRYTDACLDSSIACPPCSCSDNFLMRSSINSHSLMMQMKNTGVVCSECTRAKFNLYSQWHKRSNLMFSCLNEDVGFTETSPPVEYATDYATYDRVLSCPERSQIKYWFADLDCKKQTSEYNTLLAQTYCGRAIIEDAFDLHHTLHYTGYSCSDYDPETETDPDGSGSGGSGDSGGSGSGDYGFQAVGKRSLETVYRPSLETAKRRSLGEIERRLLGEIERRSLGEIERRSLGDLIEAPNVTYCPIKTRMEILYVE